MEIKELREQIDIIDDELVRLFAKRMDISKQVAEYKKENSIVGKICGVIILLNQSQSVCPTALL